MRGKNKLFIFLFLAIGPGLLRGGFQKQSEENGVRIVHNNLNKTMGERTRIKLELVRTIGGPNETDPNFAFGAPYDTVLDSAGNYRGV